MRITVEINTDNDAFGSPNEQKLYGNVFRDQEVARILTVTADKIHEGMLDLYPEGFPVRDINGNTCGAVKVLFP